jgi:dTDP-4-amino-4,6-dideoxygalactose transaminase
MDHIPYNKPYITGFELSNIETAYQKLKLSGDGQFTTICHDWLAKHTRTPGLAFLAHSCTAALEMAAMAANVGIGDEVIMPSYTFVSTANAFVLQGATPVFVDIRPDTQNIDESLIEEAISSHTKAIVPVHYSGVACEMDSIMRIAKSKGLIVIEDAAQALMATYKDSPLGGIGDYGTFSFHETKNIISGEGGALIVRDGLNAKVVELIREKGTDRSQFLRGEVDKYTWRSVGSSYLPSEITAAFLCAQLEHAAEITATRKQAWEYYDLILSDLRREGLIVTPSIPEGCNHNGHIYYILLSKSFNRSAVLRYLRERGIDAISHYVPLHSSPGGKKYGRISGRMTITDFHANSLIRLPLWIGINQEQQIRVVEELKNALLHHK